MLTRLPDDFLFSLLERNPIADEFRKYTVLNACDKGFHCSCLFHSEAAKSCFICPETHNFYCPVCGTGGDIITFLMIIQNISYVEAVQILAQRSHLTVPQSTENTRIQYKREKCYQINRDTANFYYQNLLRGPDKRGLAYLRQRRLRPEIIQKYGLGFAPDDWHQLQYYLTEKGYTEEELLLANVCRKSEKGNIYDNFRNRVIFPIVDKQNHVIGFGGRVLDDSKPKYLNTSDTPVFDKGRNLFSLHFASQHSPSSLILAEGYMDVIALHQAGFENAVATLGTAITPQQARLIAQHAAEVIISYDSDNAGQNATQKAIRHFQDVGLPTRILHMTEAKDPDEYIRSHGAEKFRILLNNAINVTDFQLECCKNGLDLQTENGKVAFLRRIVQVLSEIGNAKKREYYITKKAQELEIRPEVLQKQVERFIAGQKRHTLKADFQIIENSIRSRDTLNPKSREHLKESRSEQIILAYLMRFPEQYKSLCQKITPEDFITDFHRKIYEILCRLIPDCTWVIPSLLGSDLSVEEISRITGIFISYRDIILNEEVVLHCISNLQTAKDEIPDKSNMSDNDLIQVIANKKKKIRLLY